MIPVRICPLSDSFFAGYGLAFFAGGDKSVTEEVFQQIKSHLEENGMKSEREPRQ